MASERFDEFMRAAQTTSSINEAAFFTRLAAAEALGRIADVLEAAWEDAGKDLVAEDEHGKRAD